MKVITEFDYKIIMLCKQGDISALIDLLEEELWITDINYQTIYHHLANTLFNVYDKNYIQYIYTHQLEKMLIYKFLEDDDTNFDYQDLVKLLMKNLLELKLRDNNKDLYKISVNEEILTYNEYFKYINQSKTKKKNL